MVAKAAIIVPFYKPGLGANERIALEQCFRILGSHPIVAIKPEKLVFSPEITSFNFSEVISFPDKYFDGIHGYNELMLSEHFYGNFLNWEYILIHQLDAFVFADELDYWCSIDAD